MIRQIEHIGIAVKDLDKAEAIYESLLGIKPYKRELVASENVMTSFFKKGQKIELLASTTEDGVIAKFIEKKVKEYTTSLLKSVTSMQKWKDCNQRALSYSMKNPNWVLTIN